MTRLSLLLVVACGHSLDPRLDVTSPPFEIPVGANPVDVAAADLDGDGKLDLASANAGDRTISVRLQRGGDWLAAVELPVEFQLHMIAAADVDADLDQDLIATGHDVGTVAVYLGDGLGHFTAAAGSPFVAVTTAVPHNHGLAIGDLDGDGDADVVAADQTARLAVVLLADGTGGLGAPAAIELPGQTYPPALGDLDGDGDLDLVAPVLDRRAIAVLLGDGRGGFAPAAGSPIATAHARPYAIALADVDGDRDLDIVAPHDDTDAISVLLGDGAGAFATAASSPISAGFRMWRLAAADVDRDGAIDLIGAGSGSLAVLRNTGGGTFARPQVAPSGGWVAIAADLDGDGRVELISPESGAGLLRLWAP